MKRLNIILPLAILYLMASCGSGHEGHEGHDDHEHEAHEHQQSSGPHSENEAEAGHEHGDEISVSHEVEERFGVKCDTVRIEDFSPAVRVTGKAIPSASDMGMVVAPRTGVVRFAPGISQGSQVSRGSVIATVDATAVSGGDANHAAKARLDAAKRELDRLKPLYDDKLVTASDYNAALSAYEQAKADYSPAASGGRSTASIAGVITSLDVRQGEHVEAGAPIATISSSSSLTLRFDVPHKYYSSLGKASEAIIFLPGETEGISLKSLGGRRISADVAADAAINSSFLPVYYTVKNDGRILPGMAFSAYLTSGTPTPVLAIPVSALSEQQGELFVYEQVHPGRFMKRPVKIGNRNGRYATVVSGIDKGAVIAVDGVTTVRLAETSTVAPEGHSHNH